ncbi:hypothetical protein [Niabella sp.]|uniref:hypothetical protein n=1 Tax=Niabella sp. TaxID=1962976 RepID=UPI002608B09F|nr:hypothetical protein [Niabella sp.]
MIDEKKYPQEETPLPVLQEPDVWMKTFSSQEEADLHRLKKNLARTDMERFQIMCRMIRIGKMLSQAGKTSRL